MTIDPQLHDFLSTHNRHVIAWDTVTADQARDTANTTLTSTVHFKVAKSEDKVTNDARKVPVRIYTPEGGLDKLLPVVVYFHGGGWVTGSIELFDAVCRGLCSKSGAIVVSVEYKLAPEHKFPEGLEDAYAATTWAAKHAETFGGNAEHLAVAGDSAGGNFAAAVSILARDRSGPKIKLQLLLYPVVLYESKQTGYTQSAQDNSTGYYLDLDKMAWYFDQYLEDPSTQGRHEHLVSVSLAKDLSNLPEAVILTVEYDILKDQGYGYAEKLRHAGVKVEYKCYPGQIHSFIGFAVTQHGTDAGLAAISDAGQYIKTLLAQ